MADGGMIAIARVSDKEVGSVKRKNGASIAAEIRMY